MLRARTPQRNAPLRYVKLGSTLYTHTCDDNRDKRWIKNKTEDDQTGDRHSEL